MTWIDISQPLSNRIAVWPGDTPFEYRVSYSKEESGSSNVGSITMSAHTGTHIDAPFHFDNDGKRVLELNIDTYIGPARVVDVAGLKYIGAKHLQEYDLKGVSRLLLKTNASLNAELFPEEIPYIDESLPPFLKEKGIILLGTDVPSVDPLDSKELPAHHALNKYGVHILENLVLQHIEPGEYELIALPLALKEADGSPVRAVIRPL
ncbi:MAG: arylformamidase [Bacillus sp. (in: firmicutes)]